MQEKKYDEFDIIADYVFQVASLCSSGSQITQFFWGQNSDATFALMHHRDLVEIHRVGYTIQS